MATHISHHHARVAALSRDRDPDDPDLVDARQNLNTAMLAAHIEKVLAKGPSLTTEQCEHLSALLRSTTGSGDAA
ncbi:hypothetical protein CJ179_50280 [Rhodococcus sp. ACS1]|uniref:hypothetical protein n=1 Tax=Rhodococcus sp. ACS1 TaxID=2028570 RepID=UPI000BB0D238|nr:hypothetical protein [Rhodococcus sp. ACS1]PBC35028.1 hypothetical protein CJ179_50280 [Rhodococcus sp. ACS1]